MPKVSTELEDRILKRKWFYEFILPSGRKTELYIHPALAEIHNTRLAMMFSVLDPMFRNRWADVSVLDIASHEGFFACHLASRGCRRVLGIDTRAEHIQNASLIRDAFGYRNLEFSKGDAQSLVTDAFPPAEIVVMFGLLYHLENPVATVRLGRELTKEVCLIETQIAPNLSGTIEWGSCYNHKEIPGTFAVIDEKAEVSTDNKEASVTGISLVPSKEVLIWLLKRFGFNRVEIVPPPSDGYEQLVSGNRIMLAAFT
jgi:hypothetical protein